MILMKQALIVLAALSLVTGLAYPLLLTGIASAFLPRAAQGSLQFSGGRVTGSELLAQRTDDPGRFQPRPSACGWTNVPSSAANVAPSSRALGATRAARAAEFRRKNGLTSDAAIPGEMLTASASGLDPHIGRAAALLQVGRIAHARHVDPTKVRALVDAATEAPQFGFLGVERINVQILNAALDHMTGAQ